MNLNKDMETTIFERIQLIINNYNLNDVQFAEKARIKQSTFSKGKSRNSDLKYMTIVNILTAFPEISTDWFVMGKGRMFIDGSTDDVTFQDYAEMRRTIKNLNDYVEELQVKIATLEGKKDEAKAVG